MDKRCFIHTDQFLLGLDIQKVLQQLLIIWSYLISPESDKRLVHGRGSPEMRFKQTDVGSDFRARFEGAMPSTIYPDMGLSEVYARSPDIDPQP